MVIVPFLQGLLARFPHARPGWTTAGISILYPTVDVPQNCVNSAIAEFGKWSCMEHDRVFGNFEDSLSAVAMAQRQIKREEKLTGTNVSKQKKLEIVESITGKP